MSHRKCCLLCSGHVGTRRAFAPSSISVNNPQLVRFSAHAVVSTLTMTIPVTVDADPDPTSQIAWPAARHRQRTTSSNPLEPSSAESYQSKVPQDVPQPKRVQFSTWDLFTLSVSMAGAQVTWTVELGRVHQLCRIHSPFHMHPRQVWYSVSAIAGHIRAGDEPRMARRSCKRTDCTTPHR